MGVGPWRIRVVRAHSIKMMAGAQRWDTEMIEAMQGTQWRPDPTRTGCKIPTMLGEEEVEHEESEERLIVVADEYILDVSVAEPNAPKGGAFGVRRSDASRYGMSEGCRSCTGIRRGWSNPVAHSDKCRDGILQ